MNWPKLGKNLCIHDAISLVFIASWRGGGGITMNMSFFFLPLTLPMGRCRPGSFIRDPDHPKIRISGEAGSG